MTNVHTKIIIIAKFMTNYEIYEIGWRERVKV